MTIPDETGQATVTDIAQTTAPWGKDLLVQALSYDSGLRVARLRIREGRRFTLVDLDTSTATWLAAALREALAPHDHDPSQPAT